MSDLVGNPEDQFSQKGAHLKIGKTMDTPEKLKTHYHNKPMQYTVIYGCKNGNFQMKNCDIFTQNINCGYMLEPPQ